MSDEMTPQEAKAYDRGAYARKRGRSRSDNPFHCATPAQADKYWAWFKGYDDASKPQR